MRLSPAAEFAIRGASVLAQRGGDSPITLQNICDARDLPRQYLAKIFVSLSRVGLITPIRGKCGGYLLARDAKDISLLDIIEAVEGPLALNFCQHHPPRCKEVGCPLRETWTDLQGIFRKKLGGVTLADCIMSSR